MPEKPNNLANIIEIEQKIIHLMLKTRSVIEEMIDAGLSADLFDFDHRPLVNSIFREFMAGSQGRLLTREAYAHYLKENGESDIIQNLYVWDKCYLGIYADPNEFGILHKKLVEGFIGRQAVAFMGQFGEDAKKYGYLSAARQLVDSLQGAVGVTETRRAIFANLPELKDEYLSVLEDKKNNPGKIIRCKIPEIDDVVNVGFQPQHLTLFVGDIGSFKTATMLNVGLNLADGGYTVLFIPLEMSRFDLINRIIANRAGINFNKLAHPNLMTPDDFTNIKKCEVWLKENSHFYILDADERTGVASLKREIEKKASIISPAVVIIDYIALLKPDVKFAGRNDLEIGEITKSLRFLGKKYNFHTISAAQMGRAAIRALRENKEEAVDSTAIQGSHQYSADSDTIFGLVRLKDEMDKIKLLTMKARHGPMGKPQFLAVDPAHCRVWSGGPGALSGNMDEHDLHQSDMDIKKENEKQKHPSDLDWMIGDL